MYAGDARPFSSVSTSPCPRPSRSVGVRDVSWGRALLAVPDQLLSALRAEGSARPGSLCKYPRVDTEELYGMLGEMLGENVAPFVYIWVSVVFFIVYFIFFAMQCTCSRGLTISIAAVISTFVCIRQVWSPGERRRGIFTSSSV